ncbi:tor signaling pathway regulator [Lichtheimia corymbifera JMRC:FSU:9682]|uniref:Tor signaling pathway regulator n=1 Tax=Lichtheimia corymbifera JMRC:FSU:9682 TaxID=1263082 RepID=A0A068RHZ9_9FUNG|nr:tor signaling pathway regulator [Lichtheimia corymbifera JMRC:FSU:9682]
MDLNNASLGELFISGQTILNELEDTTLASIDPEYQAKVHDALSRLERAHDLVHQLSIFSSNELIDDMNPNDMRFLLIPVYLGDLTLKVTDRNQSRRHILETAKNHFNTYMNACEEHQLLSGADLDAYKRSVDNSSSTSNRSLPPAQQRQQKIEMFKREKATEQRIRELRERLNVDENEDKDDIERDWVLALIQLHILKALQHLHSIDQELVMVKEMEAMSEDRQRMSSTAGRSDEQTARTDMRPSTWGRDKPLLSKEGRPLQPFVITNKRQALKDQVFRPGWSLPTMSIDDYLAQEEARGNIIRGGGEPPSEEKKEIDDNDYEAQDAETMRQRNWDEFVEANPKGWGNRGNKG